MSLVSRLGAIIAWFKRDGVVRLLALVIACVGLGLLVVDYGGGAAERLSVGDVAPRTVRAPRTFTYDDTAAHEALRDQARAQVLPVFVHDPGLIDEQRHAVEAAFRAAQEDMFRALEVDDAVAEPQALRGSLASSVVEVFRSRLGVQLPDAPIQVLLHEGFPDDARDLTLSLLEDANSRLIVADRDVLPADRGPISLVDAKGQRPDREVRDLASVLTPEQARREIDVRKAVLGGDGPWRDAAASVAQALLRPNLTPDPELTRARRSAAAAAVPEVRNTVKRGAVLVREGEELTQESVARYQGLRRASGPAVGLEIVAATFFLALLVLTLVHFGSSNLSRFSLGGRDIAAVASLLLLAGLLIRVVVGLSDGIASIVGYGCEPRNVWFVVPVAGITMLVRLLVGVNWALVASVIIAAVAGLLMDLDALMVLYVLLSSVVAAGMVEHTRERLAVLRAGMIVGLASAAVALLIHFLSYFLGEGQVVGALTMQPVWAMVFALLGGLFSSFMVLALMPLFERVGFVTDYRLMELANLNHPLMKQLMLRAPGSYHHSVVVGSLAEAACEEVGANALQTRVAAYFHDIGKALKPQYFVENQGSQGNRHTGLDPHTSAAIIISHVTDGAELARRHRLPKPCLDNIYMHHGTGLLQYFHAKAVEEAGDEAVDESAFRYPGPRPDSRESGILMLADKVEAATRTIKEPTEEKFRSMIHAIINSVMADDQFADCPLTFKELYQISDAFVGVLLGIHHQRIEYPQTSHLSAGRDVPPPPRGPDIITLEIPTQEQLRQPSPVPAGSTSRPVLGDYEAVEHLPGSGSNS